MQICRTSASPSGSRVSPQRCGPRPPLRRRSAERNGNCRRPRNPDGRGAAAAPREVPSDPRRGARSPVPAGPGRHRRDRSTGPSRGCAAGFGQVDLDGSAVPWIIRADDQSLPFQCDHGLRDGALGRAQKCCEGTGMARVAIGAREIPERFPLRRNQATAPLQRVGQAAETLDQVGDTWGCSDTRL